jgi:hypothetical protein
LGRVPKLDMWLTGNHHLPHAGQDTNAAIESYHGNMQAVLRASKGRLVGRRVDWLIHELTHDVIMKYEYNRYLEESGFISNKKAERLVINSVLRSLKIPDSCVSLPTEAGQPVLVTSSERPRVRYAVYNPDTEWACCECVHAQNGNLCKHQIEVLRMMKPELAAGTIVKVCGTLYGTRVGGVSVLRRPLSPPADSPRRPSSASEEDVDGGSLEYVRLDSPEGEEWMESDETLDARIAELGLQITERASRRFVIGRQLVMELWKMDMEHARLEA